MTGRVFSIEEFSIFDGDGIRTTVFLKGCPLRCEWCHSPEGQSREIEYLRSPNGCLGCGKCLDAGEKWTGRRVLCEKSVEVCPRNLVRVSGEDYTPKRLTEKLLKNADILNAGGGGVTFSGGEPLMQHEFLFEMLKALKGKLNRAVQTTGFTDGDTFEKILSETDLMLYDLKLMDSALHKKYTGVGNELILSNYKSLVRSGIKFITRVPLIPGVSDTDDNLEALCAFLDSNAVKYVELLPYNKYAGSKYKLCGREYRPSFDENREINFGWEKFKKHGIKAVKL